MFNFSLNENVARFYADGDGREVRRFHVRRDSIVALFTRRGEAEVITFDAEEVE